MKIQINTLELPPWKVISLTGRIDAFNDKRVLQVIHQTLGPESIHFAVDLSQVDFIGFYALQEILKLAVTLKSRAGELCLVGPTVQVRRHLDSFTGHQGVRIFRDLEELQRGFLLKPRSEHSLRGNSISF
jgi:anti-anti-sigma factor